MCKDVGYSTTSFPNGYGHFTQAYAERELKQLSALIKTDCSKHIKEYMCARFVPKCSDSKRIYGLCPSFKHETLLMCRSQAMSLLRPFVAYDLGFTYSAFEEWYPLSSDQECYAPSAYGKAFDIFWT